MVKKIRLVATSSGKTDTRYGTSLPTKQELYENSMLHINDVRRICKMWAENLMHDAYRHDWTKMKYIDQFHKDFVEARVHKTSFVSLEWYKLHILNENHHIYDLMKQDNQPFDFVDLLDVIQLCADWVASGKVRSDDHKFVLDSKKFDYDVLKNMLWYAFLNTLKKMDSQTTVVL